MSNPYRTRAIEREPAPPKTIGYRIRRLDYLFTERPARWMVPAGLWFFGLWAYGLILWAMKP